MEKQIVTIKTIKKITPDVLQVVVDKPADFTFVPGQATEISIRNEQWKNEGRPFTFTNLPTDDYLEFTIKTYPSHEGVTNQFLKLSAGDELVLHDVFGDIAYKGEGVFIAGGAGVTPFLAILRHLKATNAIANNKLIFANKTRADIIHEQEFSALLGKNFINVLSDEKTNGYENGFISKELLEKYVTNLNTNYYLCGPPPMMDAVENILAELLVDENMIIKETY